MVVIWPQYHTQRKLTEGKGPGCGCASLKSQHLGSGGTRIPVLKSCLGYSKLHTGQGYKAKLTAGRGGWTERERGGERGREGERRRERIRKAGEGGRGGN